MALAVGAVLATVLAGLAAGFTGAPALLDAGVGLILLLVAIVTRADSARYAAGAAAAGLGWVLGAVVPALAWAHRPLVVWVVVAFPDGRLRRRPAGFAVAAAVLIAFPPLATQPLAMGVVGAGVAWFGVGELVASRSWPGLAARARGWAGLCAGAAFLVPLAATLIEPSRVETGYAALLGIAGLVLLASAAGGVGTQAEAVIALAEHEDSSATLRRLKAQRETVPDPATGRALDSAIALLADNLAGQAALDSAVEQARRSRRALVGVTLLERRALRRRLTDTAVPRLARIEDTLAGVPDGQAAGGDLLPRCRAELRGLAMDLDRLADGLHPAQLAARGLAALAEVATGSAVPTLVHLPGRRYPAETEAAVWYACSEAMTNALKHGLASQTRIDAAERDGVLTVEVHDNGVGGAALTPGGGLAGVRDRLAALGGELSVDSPAGRGTTVRIRVPVS